jgi:hypothetical protein
VGGRVMMEFRTHLILHIILRGKWLIKEGIVLAV